MVKKNDDYSDYGEDSSYLSEKNFNYIKENKLFERLEALYECTRRVSSGVNHFVGFVG